jgi:hypothetical protein
MNTKIKHKYLAIIITLTIILSTPVMVNAQEPGQDMDSALEIQVPGDYSGKLSSDNEADYYKFWSDGNEIIKIEFSSDTEWNQELYLYTPDQQSVFKLTSENNEIHSEDFVLANETDPSYWYIEVTPWDVDESAGDYEFTVRTTTQNDAQSGGDVPSSWDNAYEIEEDEYTGFLSDMDEADMYKIQVQPSSIIEIEFSSDTEWNQELRLYNPDRQEMFKLKSENNEIHSEDFVFANETDPSYWYIEVTPWDVDESAGDYTFTITTTTQDDAGSGADVPSGWDEAYEIEEGEYTGFLSDMDEADMYKINIESDSIIEVEFSSDTEWNQELRLYNPDRQEMFKLTSENNALESNEYEATSEEAGYWYIEVTPWDIDESAGNYTFRIKNGIEDDTGTEPDTDTGTDTEPDTGTDTEPETEPDTEPSFIEKIPIPATYIALGIAAATLLITRKNTQIV